MSRIELPALLAACAPLLGCVAVDQHEVQPGIFDIATPANRLINSEERAQYVLRLRSGELCPRGFDRLRESRIVDASATEIMSWRIACRMP